MGQLVRDQQRNAKKHKPTKQIIKQNYGFQTDFVDPFPSPLYPRLGAESAGHGNGLSAGGFFEAFAPNFLIGGAGGYFAGRKRTSGIPIGA
ncbi:MAG: hypothetical protein KGJ13_00590 [Patescibacteria group bacterium]|nr:hypothetical protein [Patescibacteria group bacterium]